MPHALGMFITFLVFAFILTSSVFTWIFWKKNKYYLDDITDDIMNQYVNAETIYEIDENDGDEFSVDIMGLPYNSTGAIVIRS